MSVSRLATAILVAATAVAQQHEVNYDEAKVPAYSLPDPLTLGNGERVRDAATWNLRRRPEILDLFSTYVYGRTPRWSRSPESELLSHEAKALGGKAIRREVRIYPAGRDGPGMNLLLYLPASARGPVPTFLGLNFSGNHTVSPDPGIRLSPVWVRDQATKTWSKSPATPDSRGKAAAQWQVEMIIARGFGLATIYYGEIEPDFGEGRKYGMARIFGHSGQVEPDEWGSIGVWAWGVSRAVDYLISSEKGVDPHRIIVVGHSRLGKTALWAAAQDTRIAMAISNNSGEGGAALARRKFGERIDGNANFPYWYCLNHKKFSYREEDLPVDQHMLLALIAPRPVYIASAEEDRWADPRGEFLSAVAAGPVYRLLGQADLGTSEMPPIEQPIMKRLGYHIRAGKHDVTAYDWRQFLAFAELNLSEHRR